VGGQGSSVVRKEDVDLSAALQTDDYDQSDEDDYCWV